MTGAEAEEAIGWIEDLYSKAIADLEGQGVEFAEETTLAEMTQIRDTMLLLTPTGKVRTVYNDYSCMRP